MVDEPQIRRYYFRLHRSGRPWDKRADEVDWDETAIGDAVLFDAFHFGVSAWYARGPVTIAAPEDVPDGAWSVSTGAQDEPPLMVGKIGRPLSAGDEFALPVSDVIVGGVARP